MDHEVQVLESFIIIVIIIIIIAAAAAAAVSCHKSFPPCTSLESMAIPTNQTAVLSLLRVMFQV